MRKLILLLATLCGLVLFVPPAGALPTPSPVYSWGHPPFSLTYSVADDLYLPHNGPTEFSEVTTTNTNTYVLDTSTTPSTVWAVGDTGAGLGNGTASTTPPAPTTTFVQVDFPTGVDIKSLASVGPNETEMAIDSSGNVWGWGLNSYDQLCMKGQQDRPVELTKLTNVPNDTNEPTQYTLASGAGDHASYYDSTTNTIYSCGGNKFGELGDGSTDKSLSPMPVAVSSLDPENPTATVTAMTASWRNEGVIMSDNTYWNWGIDTFGQLGNGSTTNADAPFEVTDFPAGSSVLQAAEGGGGTGDSSTMALVSVPGEGDVYYGWGDDQQGQLCDSMTGNTNNYDTPHSIMITVGGIGGPQLPSPISSLVAGGETGFVLTMAGAVYGCGDDSHGEIGMPELSTSTNYPPTQIPLGGDASQISSTNWNTAALVPSGG
jgi:alpha-tubulin suppressor-like RCC1 family protein